MVNINELSTKEKELLQKRLSSIDIQEKKSLIEKNNTLSYPLSYSQKRLWFLNQLLTEKYVYNIPVLFEIKGDLRIDVLNKSLNKIIQRHEMLRTTFHEYDGEVFQKVSPELKININLLNLTEIKHTEKESKIKKLIDKEVKFNFDLTKGPLVRVLVLREEEEKYLLLLNMHHIVTDGWSSDILFKELKTFYSSYLRSELNEEKDLPIQYGDFAIWQSKQLNSDYMASQMNYWKNKLSGDLPLLELPLYQQRPKTKTYNGAIEKFILNENLVSKLRDFSIKCGVTPFMFLLSAYKVLLYKYTDTKDILVGSPIANRNHKDTENMIGFFVNTLVFRTDLSEDLTFSDVLQQVRRVSLEAYENQDIPFEKLVEELAPDQRGASPLFQAAFSFYNTSKSKFDLEGLLIKQIPLESTISKFDLTLAFGDSSKEMEGIIEYNSDLYSTETIINFKEHFINLLEDVINNPQKRIKEINILTPKQMKTILFDWNDTKKDKIYNNCVHYIIEEEARKNPLKVAAVFEEKSITYQDLNTKANQLARYLVKKGIKVGDPVLVYTERNLEMLIMFLAVLKAGGAYVPVDPVYPTERLADIIEDAKIQFILVQNQIVHTLPEGNSTVILYDSLNHNYDSEDISNIDILITLESNAYVIYTSGSTGKPKGVVVPHLGLINLVDWTVRMFNITRENRASQYLRTAFDGSVWEIWPYLARGATLYLVSEEIRIDPIKIKDWLIDNKINTTILPPSVVQEILSLKWPKDVSLKYIFTGSDRVHECNLDGIPFKIINAYGPTEASVISSYSVIENNKKLPHVGKPVPNFQIYILDESLNPVPVGVMGEIYIAGDGLSRGYINNPDLTAEKFLPNPFNSNKASRMYKTGDLARYLPDGNIDFIGRIDNQVKIRGFRIEIGDIETILGQHPDIDEAMVLVKENEQKSKSLVAIGIIRNKEKQIDKEQVIEYLKNRLPNYMIPNQFIWLQSWPLTPNGKIDRKQLLVIANNIEMQRKIILPRNNTEKQIKSIWESILRIANIGVDENFFEIGGHSLLLTKIMGAIQETFRVEIPLHFLFEMPTISGMAKQVEDAQNKDIIDSKIPNRTITNNLPLSFAQNRLWFINSLTLEKGTYNVPMLFDLNGDVDIQALNQSINQVIKRHEILRTHFKDGETVVQVISDSLEIDLPVIDLTHLSEEKRQDRIIALRQEEVHKPFDLEVGPLIRSMIVKEAPTKYLFILNLHHIITDGWSSKILINEIASLYTSYVKKVEANLPSLPLQYGDYAVWQRDKLKGSYLNKQISYWVEKLKGSIPTLSLPTDYATNQDLKRISKTETIELSSEIVKAIRKLSYENNSTSYMTFMAAFKVLLYRYTGQEDLSIGTLLANRNKHEIEHLIGFFVNTLVMRTRVSGSQNFKELLAGVKDTVLEAYANQEVPFEKVVEELQPERTLSQSPLFQVVYTYEKNSESAVMFDNVSVSSHSFNVDYTKFDLILAVEELSESANITMEYDSSLFATETIIRMLNSLKMIIEEVVRSCETNIDEISILSTKDKTILTNDFIGSINPVETSLSICDLIENQSVKQKLNTAVVYQEKHLTYEELNEKSNQLAHYLMKQGVTSNVPVAICVNRGFEYLIGILGVLKAGGAYVPLDPGYPKERLDFIIEDSQAQLVLTTSDIAPTFNQGNVLLCMLDQQLDFTIHSSTNLEWKPKLDDLAYIIYTSGSTGQPKGVMVTHRSLLNLISWHQSEYQLSHEDRSTLIAGLGFDAAVWEIFPCLCSGATLYILEEEIRSNPVELQQWMTSNGITISFVPTPLVEPLLELDWSSNHTLKFMLTGGERLVISKGYNIPFRLINHYGPTENTVVTTFGEVDVTGKRSESPSIGKPIANVQTYILDKNLKPVPIGVVGELCIGGASLAEGYKGQHELTVEKFIAHPFSKESGARLYKTGDMVRYLPDGSIDFIGRKDNQVKIRGYRIELGEIEYGLKQHPNVKEAIVLAINYTISGKSLVAFIINKDEELTQDEYRWHLKSLLPNYMIPTRFINIQSIPLTQNGKIDYDCLKMYFDKHLNNNKEMIKKPESDLHKKLKNIWSEILGNVHIGLDDNFFELGGDSILALQIVARAKNDNITFSIRDLFKYQTISDLAKVVKLETVKKEFQPVSTDLFSLTPIQTWFFKTFKNVNHFNMTHILSIKEKLEPKALERAIITLVNHHDSLRLKFQQKDQYQQQYDNNQNHNLFEVIKLSNLSNVDQKEYILNYSRDIQTIFNIKKGTNIIFKYFDLGIGETDYLLISIHHLVTDAVSWRILLNDLEEIYKYELNKENKLTLFKTSSYKEWSEALLEYLQSSELKAEVSYWREQTTKYDFPTDFDQESNSFGSSQTISYTMNQSIIKDILVKINTYNNVSINDVLVAALFNALMTYSHQEELLINMEGHGREDVLNTDIDLSRTVGWFTSIYPLLLKNKESTSLKETVLSVSKQLKRIPKKGFGFGLLKYMSEDYQIKRELDSLKQPPVSFNYLGQYEKDETNTGIFTDSNLSVNNLIDDHEVRNHLLDVSCVIKGQTLRVDWIYNPESYSPDTIHTLSNNFQKFLFNLLKELNY
ncbi:amino acid adenylation domain-containing protein (plasmid) [Bacillus sp. ZJS3]|uniref:non-ribosomal peptide synthetase n=1 Tax=Bacillus sp. ZJS3 TaxID=2928154 RepID=UPI001FB3A78A|nr:non-ribosomal peptide synthetase [Bacillus sp. ZJS3]UOB81927.1 amino acid adenylation domain-containing protein [Bacillus sp. ZJS3]